MHPGLYIISVGALNAWNDHGRVSRFQTFDLLSLFLSLPLVRNAPGPESKLENHLNKYAQHSQTQHLHLTLLPCAPPCAITHNPKYIGCLSNSKNAIHYPFVCGNRKTVLGMMPGGLCVTWTNHPTSLNECHVTANLPNDHQCSKWPSSVGVNVPHDCNMTFKFPNDLQMSVQ